MENYICMTCGTQYSASNPTPTNCPICEDERQYIGFNGQQWTTLEALQSNHHNIIKRLEPGLYGIASHPDFAIGQRALFITSPSGNVLWDCISLIDEPTISFIQSHGGLSAIAISPPHFYSSMVEWSRAFNAPVYLHAADQQWVMRKDDCIQFWEGNTKTIADGITLIHCGGHFPGSQALHWHSGADGKGALFTGDTITVVPDRRYVSFMYSYPNLIPLNANTVEHIRDTVESFEFDRIYGGWWDRVVQQDGKAAVRRSADRYIKHLGNTR